MAFESCWKQKFKIRNHWSKCFFFFHFECREVCKNEFIIPLGPELKDMYNDDEMRHSLRSLQTESVRPQLRLTEIVYVYRHQMRKCSKEITINLNKFWFFLICNELEQMDWNSQVNYQTIMDFFIKITPTSWHSCQLSLVFIELIIFKNASNGNHWLKLLFTIIVHNRSQLKFDVISKFISKLIVSIVFFIKIKNQKQIISFLSIWKKKKTNNMTMFHNQNWLLTFDPLLNTNHFNRI